MIPALQQAHARWKAAVIAEAVARKVLWQARQAGEKVSDRESYHNQTVTELQAAEAALLALDTSEGETPQAGKVYAAEVLPLCQCGHHWQSHTGHTIPVPCDKRTEQDTRCACCYECFAYRPSFDSPPEPPQGMRETRPGLYEAERNTSIFSPSEPASLSTPPDVPGRAAALEQIARQLVEDLHQVPWPNAGSALPVVLDALRQVALQGWQYGATAPVLVNLSQQREWAERVEHLYPNRKPSVTHRERIHNLLRDFEMAVLAASQGQGWQPPQGHSEASEILAWLNLEQKKAERWSYSRGDSGVYRFGLTGPELMRIRHALGTPDGEWQCRFVAEDGRCCQLGKDHYGDHALHSPTVVPSPPKESV